MYDDLDLDDATLVHLHDLEGEVVEVDVLVQVGEVALELEQEAGQRVGVALDLLEELVVKVELALEVGEHGLGLEEVGVAVELHVGALYLVVLVVDLAHNLLDDVLEGDEAEGASELVDNDGDVDLAGLEVAQEVVNLLGLGNEEGGTDEGLPTETVALGQMGKKVLDVEDALDVVDGARIDGDARIDVLGHAGEDLLVAVTDVERHHVETRGHDVLGGLVAEADDAFEQLLLVGELGLVGELKGLLQLVDREVVALLLLQAVDQTGGAHEHRRYGREHIGEDVDHRSAEPAELKRIDGGVELGHYLTEEQKQEGEQHRDEEKLEPYDATEIEHRQHGIVAEHGDGDVDEVIGDEDGGQQLLGLAEQLADDTVTGTVALLDLVEVRGSEREEGYLRCRHETGAEEQRARQQGGYDDTCRGGRELNGGKGINDGMP